MVNLRANRVVQDRNQRQAHVNKIQNSRVPQKTWNISTSSSFEAKARINIIYEFSPYRKENIIVHICRVKLSINLY